MATRSKTVDRNAALRVFDGLTAVMAAVFTLFTIYYAVFTLTNLSLAGISVRQYFVGTPGLEMLLFDERAEYVVLFLGWGLAVYYFDYARKELKDRLESDSGDGAPDVPKTVTLLDDLGVSTDALSKGIRRVKSAYARVDPYLAVGLGVLALVTMVYIYMEFSRLQGEAFILGFNSTDHAVGLALIVLVTDATRRAFGWIIASVAVLAMVYMHRAVSPSLPGMLGHTGDNFIGIVEEGALGLQSGVYDSTIMGIGSTWVAIFIMFAGMAKAYGLMDFVREVGIELGGTLRTGVVQIAVISSMVMGSITGSAAANTATTGSFTIPMIKDQGVRDDFAAAIEAVASAGGQMLPPVMGVAAFLMADILGVPYLQVIRAGAIPAALFYLSVFVAVHFTILKFGWTSDDLSSFDWRILGQGWHFAIPMGVLLTTLVYLGYTPMSAGLYTIFSMIGVIAAKNVVARLLNARSGEDSYEVNSISKQTANGLTQGGLEMAPLVGVLSAMGLIVNLLETSGLTGRLGSGIIGFADVTILGFTGGLALVLILTMIASIAFGLGMPTPAAYILVAFLVVGAATELGVPDITAHMFVFYFAMLSAITPPVAISVAVGSRIADSSFLSSCVQALRLGAPGFVIPFAFVANNELIQWTSTTAFAFPVVLAGTIALIVATTGFDGAKALSAPIRLVYIAAGFAAMFGSVIGDGMVGMGVQALAAVLVVLSLVRARYLVGYDVERARETSASD
jgi:TRAP transporter 4TM/12TM fusion protein